MSSESATPSSEPATPSSAKKAVRQKFVAINDVVLLRAVNAFQPWRAPAGTANEILKVFEDIAVHCGADPDFGVGKPGLALCTRFSTLVINFNHDQCRSMRPPKALPVSLRNPPNRGSEF
ncbi:unnamed protein product [Phytophthora fragariaefolia]|uniref:Unnamed protein product n=1 Tax=Phytophthora fragariaefolia TaxID=1490495 RepID=A0A9W6XX06_9STRA|nr:unnamed protein product [Phytophthora fragariaefolia]